jgi:hypothetical protein
MSVETNWSLFFMTGGEGFFGSPDKIALMKRSASLWALLKNDPRYAYYGRLVGLSGTASDTADILMAIARLTGASVANYYPKKSANNLFRNFEENGYSTDRHEHYWGGESAYMASRSILVKHSLPDDLNLLTLDETTPGHLVEEVAELCQSCDVMPVPGPTMRGRARRGVNLVATDQQGNPVANASSFTMHQQSSFYCDDVFWGMLATREDRRGEKIALILGAKVIVHMWENEGARGFNTGVRDDNIPLKTLCAKLGVTDSDWVYAQCLDTGILGSASVTK